MGSVIKEIKPDLIYINSFFDYKLIGSVFIPTLLYRY